MLGHLRFAGLTTHDVAVHAVDPERSRRGPFEIPGHEIPMAEAETQTHRRDTSGFAAVPERSGRMRPNGLVQLDQSVGRHQRRHGTNVPQTARAQLHQRIPATRIAEVDAGDGEMQRNLFIRFEVEIRQVERVTLNQVAVLLGPLQSLGHDRDALVAQEPLVPFERLTPGRVLCRIARDLVGDRIERQRPRRVQEHEYEVRDAFEPVELRRCHHQPEPTADARC